jgi:hypothetical protein
MRVCCERWHEVAPSLEGGQGATAGTTDLLAEVRHPSAGRGVEGDLVEGVDFRGEKATSMVAGPRVVGRRGQPMDGVESEEEIRAEWGDGGLGIKSGDFIHCLLDISNHEVSM